MLPPHPDQDRDPDRASWPHAQAQEANEQAPSPNPSQGYGGFQRAQSCPSHPQMQQDTPLDSYASEEERSEENTEEEDDIVPDADSLLDYDGFRDNDSGLGEGDDMSSTASVMSSIMRFRKENGRTYNGYGNRTYVLPNDEPEMDRLDFQHHLLSLTFDNQMTLCPIGKVHRVLDVGTGTGIWAIDFAEEHPEAVIIGVDVSPIQPLYTPLNVVWEIDDLEKPWTFSQKFDFIHSRMMTGSFQDWPGFVAQCYENLHPGGWIEMIDVSFPNRSDDSTLSEDSALAKWGKLMLEASNNLGCPLNTAETYKGLLRSTGFIGVTERIYKWPQNRWPEDKKQKEVGLWTLENFTSSLTGLSVALFTRGLGWTNQQLEIFLIDVRREMKDIRIHSYWPIYVVYAQKPRAVES